jgi:uncharacterized protein (TIGR02118 family)
MIKLVFCCRRQPEMTREAFQKRWLEVHGPLVRKLREQIPSMRRYVQSHSLPDEVSEAVRGPRGALEAFDGITEVWFDDLESLGGGAADDGGEAARAAAMRLLEDEAEFLDLARCHVFLTEEHEIF